MRFLPALLALAVSAALPLLGTTAAEPTTAAKTLMTQRGKLLFCADFNQALGKDWAGAKGKWEIADGVLCGAEVKADAHAAVRRHDLSLNGAIIQYAFKLGGARATSLSINGPKGHVCRVVLRPSGFAVQKDRDKKNPADKGKVLGSWDGPITPGVWHTLVVELQGNEMLATLDGKHTAFGAHDGINVPKTNLGLTVGGASVSFKDLRVWEAQPNPDWSATRAKLQVGGKAP